MSGWARACRGPGAGRVSAAQYHPYVASSATRGHFPARAICARSSAGLLVILAIPSRRPSSVIRTRTDRRRCRSIPTTCRPSYAVSIGASLTGGDGRLLLPASARSEAPLLHRITPCAVRDRGLGSGPSWRCCGRGLRAPRDAGHDGPPDGHDVLAGLVGGGCVSAGLPACL